VLEPVSTGSSHYEKTEYICPFLVADIRLGPTPDTHTGKASSGVQLKGVQMEGAGKQRWLLLPGSKALILANLVRSEEYVRERAEQMQQLEGSAAWQCNACTYINVTAKVKCGMCNTKRAVVAKPVAQAARA
jgi:hypothetical protein